MYCCREVAESWMDHYRVVLGISSPLLRNMIDHPMPRRRNIASAKSSGLHVIIESIATQVPKVKLSARVPSAPTGIYITSSLCAVQPSLSIENHNVNVTWSPSQNKALTYPLTHSPTHPPTHPPTHSLTHSLTHYSFLPQASCHSTFLSRLLQNVLKLPVTLDVSGHSGLVFLSPYTTLVYVWIFKKGEKVSAKLSRYHTREF